MTKYQYKFTHSILVKNDKNNRFQIASASDFGGADDEFRVYHNRKWLEGFHTQEGLLNIIRETCFSTPQEKPDFQDKDLVRVYYEEEGSPHITQGDILAEPIQDSTGHYVCPVRINYKTKYINCNDLTLIKRRG